MKKYIFIVMMLALTSAVFATPYASQIRVSSLQVYQGTNLTITYYINEAGGTATINIIKASDSSVVATFAGTATKGKNTVVWNGTVDNASGAKVDVGNYKVKITVNATKAVAWTEIASNSSVGNYAAASPTMLQTLWDGFSGMEIVIPNDPTKDSFGYVLCSTSANLDPQNHGLVVFNPDLSCEDGSDGQNMWLKYPLPFNTGVDYTIVWGTCLDPDDADHIWIAGQSVGTEKEVLYGKYNDAYATDAVGGVAGLDNARDIAVDKEGGTKYAYLAMGTNVLNKVAISGNQLTGSPTDILECADVLRYSKSVDFDASGNLYWTSRSNATGYVGGAIYRWSAATVAAAGAASLNESNAQWDIQFPTGAAAVEGIAITLSGNVYASVMRDTGDGAVRGIYLLGNTSTSSNIKTLSSGDRIIAPFYANDLSYYGNGIQADYAGNIYFTDRSDEQIREYGPGGTTSVPIVAPNSQTIEIVSLPLSAHNWAIYE